MEGRKVGKEEKKGRTEGRKDGRTEGWKAGSQEGRKSGRQETGRDLSLKGGVAHPDRVPARGSRPTEVEHL
jgi:hypothetical protein